MPDPKPLDADHPGLMKPCDCDGCVYWNTINADNCAAPDAIDMRGVDCPYVAPDPKPLSERMAGWPDNEPQRDDTTLVGIRPSTIRRWVDEVAALESRLIRETYLAAASGRRIKVLDARLEEQGKQLAAMREAGNLIIDWVDAEYQTYDFERLINIGRQRELATEIAAWRKAAGGT